MLNRWWLPEGEHLRIISSPLSSTDLEGVEPHMSSHILLIASSPIHHFTQPLYPVFYLYTLPMSYTNLIYHIVSALAAVRRPSA